MQAVNADRTADMKRAIVHLKNLGWKRPELLRVLRLSDRTLRRHESAIRQTRKTVMGGNDE